ncbi:phosphoglycerate dehydrogenase [Peptoniphilus sp.]|jgi:phosphoglycerate dehydrogenase-like enzyme|uniref:phosphoglycerate dehydrogenase n=1 Tax=Peptoniphilus sp. TaxID=1971214 RepID=UPI003D94FF98
MKILTTERIAKKFGDVIRDLGYEIVTYDENDVNAKEDYGEDIIIASIKMRGMDITKHKNLKYIFTITVGIDYLDLDYLKENNILLTNNNGMYSEPIAEWVVYGLLQIEKQDRLNIKNQENKIWKQRSHSFNLYGKKALFLGTGSIARASAKRLRGFEMELNGFNTNGRKVEPFTNVYSKDELDDVLKDMDYVIMCLPGTESTHHFLNKERFEKMKDGAVVVNISRGATIDEEALIDALKSRKLKGASLDVFEKEPLDKNSPLWEMDNVYIYPHISFSSEDNEEREFKSALNNLKALKGDGDFINIIDFDKGY